LIVISLTTVVAGLAWLDKKGYAKAGIRTLSEITAIFSALSLIAAFVLPAVAKAEGVWDGLSIVSAIMGVMVGMTLLLGWLGSNKRLTNAYVTMGVMTAMLLVVSAIASYMFPAIADQKDAVIAGGKVVMGIMAVMVGMTLLLGWLGNNKKMT
jgi:hypothetical protein